MGPNSFSPSLSPAMEPSSSSQKSPPKLNRQKFIARVLSPAIERQNCPICLTKIERSKSAVLTSCRHAYCVECIRKWSDLKKRKCPLCNTYFDSWFSDINLTSRSFRKERLPDVDCCKTINLEVASSRVDARRLVQRTRNELNSFSSRTRPLPWRRLFGRSGYATADDIAQRKLHWRASVYHKRLQSVPISTRNPIEQNRHTINGAKEGIVQRIQPWIRRELQALLGDPDPSIIVHVATSLFIAKLEEKNNNPSSQLCLEDNFLAPLRPFLQDRTDMFWHELRCFAVSSFSMETYDGVVEYEQLE